MTNQPELESESEPIELSIVMPCLNEAQTLETCVRKAQEAMKRDGIRGEVVIGDNGSTDGSVGSSRVDLQACKLEYSIVSPK